MSGMRGFVTKGLLRGITAFVGILVVLSLDSKPGSLQETSISIFAAPNRVPRGESVILLGSREDLPEDLAVAGSAGVSVVEAHSLSKKGLAVTVVLDTAASGKLLRVWSVSKGIELEIDVYPGGGASLPAVEKNIRPEDFVEGVLVVRGVDFIYAYEPPAEGGLASLRIHNRATGVWVAHEIAEEEDRALAEPAIDPGPDFVEVDPLESLPDTDGDGIPDFDEPPEDATPPPLQLGVGVEPGRNILDVVAVDRAGLSSWRTLEVHSTATPEEGGI
jgi:hypothetical protein